MKKAPVDEAASEPARDGRTTRSARTRDAVIEALHALIVAGDPKPNAQRIAERAGVSTRTVFAHFASLDDLAARTDHSDADLDPFGPDHPRPREVEPPERHPPGTVLGHELPVNQPERLHGLALPRKPEPRGRPHH